MDERHQVGGRLTGEHQLSELIQQHKALVAADLIRQGVRDRTHHLFNLFKYRLMHVCFFGVMIDDERDLVAP